MFLHLKEGVIMENPSKEKISLRLPHSCLHLDCSPPETITLLKALSKTPQTEE